tara:strand:- start:2011 stop:3150 length:1140 start_codon:yes stop_codon:yes gene_type:complete
MKNEIKVLYIIENIDIGGAENLLLFTIKHLNREVFCPVVIFLFKGDTLREKFNKLGIVVKGPILSKQVSFVDGILGLRKEILKISPDIIHTHLFYANFYGRVAGWLAGVKKIVSTLHNPDYTYEKNTSIRFILRKVADKYTGRFINKKFIAVSEAAKKDFENNLNFKNIDVVYNAVDLNEFNGNVDCGKEISLKKELNLNKEFILLNIGRLHEQKGQSYLLKAFQHIIKKLKNIKLLIAGDGKLEQELKDLADKLGIRQNVLFLGKRNDIKTIISIADILVMPSLYEGFGIAVIEAMLLRKPVVASDIDGIREIITHNKDGILVPPENPDKLALEIEKLITHKPSRESLGNNASRTVLQNFDIAKNVKKIEQIYFEVIQ